MNEISLATQTLFSELVQRALDAEFDETFDERGQFKRKRIKGRLYWYYQRDINAKKVQIYVGPVRDEAINSRVKRFAEIKSDYSQRREMVRALVAAGLPQPDPTTSRVVEALWRAGLFRLRGLLIGTAAFQCYAGTLGVRLKGATLMTQDADFAQFYEVSRAVGDSMPPILDVLRNVDPTFKAVPDTYDRARVTRFRNRDRFLVEFLTTNRRADDHMGKPADMPALGGASATPLRYLDFLIHEPIRSVLLFKGGIPVTVPAPARYAIHKLIVAAVRDAESGKSDKDTAQATQIIRAMLVRRSFEFEEAWNEAWSRGPAWREGLDRGVGMLPKELQEALEQLVNVKRPILRLKVGTTGGKRGSKPGTKSRRKTR